MAFSTVPIVARTWAGQVASWRSRGSRPNQQRAATRASIARSLARWHGSRLAVIAQWLVAAAVIGFAGRELARQWRELGPAIAGLDPSWVLVMASGAIVLVTYLILIEAWRATLR